MFHLKIKIFRTLLPGSIIWSRCSIYDKIFRTLLRDSIILSWCSIYDKIFRTLLRDSIIWSRCSLHDGNHNTSKQFIKGCKVGIFRFLNSWFIYKFDLFQKILRLLWKKTNFIRMIFIKSSILLRLSEIEKRLKPIVLTCYIFSFFLSVDSNFGKEDSSDTTEEFPHPSLVII